MSAERGTDFLSLVAHDLRSPLATVIGAAQALQGRWPDLTDEERDTFLRLIVEEAKRLASLVDDVLDTSRLDAGTFSYHFEEIDIAALVADAVMAAAVAQEDVPVVASVGGTLPPVSGDHARLRQVLTNLVDNAVKYSPEGGTVEVSATVADGVVSVAVSDSGPGIGPEDRDGIFEKFGRADGAKPGTGLGLFISRAIAEAHGGTLEVSPLPRDGATFVLTLPAGGEVSQRS